MRLASRMSPGIRLLTAAGATAVIAAIAVPAVTTAQSSSA